MTERVREILSWYESDNPGTRTNIARLLNHGRLGGTGKLMILPVDQGFEHGPARSFAPNPAGYDPDYHYQLALAAGCNAYAAPLGFIEAGVTKFLGEIPLILKLNNHDTLHDEKDPLSSVTASVDDALRLGCVAVGFTIYPGSSQARPCTNRHERLQRKQSQKGLRWCSGRIPAGPILARKAKPPSMSSPMLHRCLSARCSHRQGQVTKCAYRVRRGEESLSEASHSD